MLAKRSLSQILSIPYLRKEKIAEFDLPGGDNIPIRRCWKYRMKGGPQRKIREWSQKRSWVFRIKN